MLKIKLSPTGKKGTISYRIAVSEARSKITGTKSAYLGYYDPQNKKIEIDRKALADWLKKGAQLTEGVAKLFKVWKIS